MFTFGAKFLKFHDQMEKCMFAFLLSSCTFAAKENTVVCLIFWGFTLTHVSNEVERLRQVANPSETIQKKLTEFQSEKRLYIASSNYLINSVISKCISDKDSAVRILAVNAFSAEILNSPALVDESHHRYLECALEDQTLKNHIAALPPLGPRAHPGSWH
jgi:peroxiredoxin family protein